MTAADLSNLVVEILHNRGDDNHPDWSVGSGFFVGMKLVLTALHNVDSPGELLVRVHGTEEHRAVVRLQGDKDSVDLAVLEVSDVAVDVPPLCYGAVDRSASAMVERCWAVGFPRFKERVHDPKPLRLSAQVNGEIPTGENLDQPLLTLQVRRSPRPLPSGAVRESEWAGMSGATVFSGKNIIVGVITEHYLPEGESALTVVPITAINLLPKAMKWWKLLGVDHQALVLLPGEAPSSGPIELRQKEWNRDSLQKPGSRCINLLPEAVDTKRFKDRDEQQKRLLKLLKENHRLIGIYGIGGVGKTALACKVLSDLLVSEDCPYDMVYLNSASTGINLDRIFTDFGKLLAGDAKVAVANIWRNQQLSTVQKVMELLNHLREGHYILLLDGLEALQNPETCALSDPDMQLFVETVLKQGNALQVVVTSRFPLALPFSLTPKERLILLEKGLPGKSAIALLRALDPDNMAGLHKAPQQVLEGLVTRTQGFPLTLVTVAGCLLARHKSLTPDNLLGKEELFASYITEDIVPKLLVHLSPDMIQVMAALALFDQPVSRTALDFLLVPSHMEPSKIPTTLDQLVTAHFIDYDKARQTYTTPHSIVKQYCYGQIPEGSPADLSKAGLQAPYTRYALHYRAAEFYEHARKPRAEWLSFDDLAAQFAEFEHRVRAGDYDTAAELVGTVDYDYLFRWGYFRRVLAMRERLVGKIGNKELESRNLGVIGEAYRYLGDFPQAISYDFQALAVDQEIDNKRGQCRWLLNIGAAYRNSGDEEKSVVYFQQGLLITQEIDDKQGECRFLTHLGFSHRTLGNYERAQDFYQKALILARDISYRYPQGVILVSLGIIHIGLGQYEQAQDCVTQGVKICREDKVRDKRWEGVGLGTLGVIYTERGKYEQAIAYHQQAIAIAREIEDQFGESFDLTRLGKTYLTQGSYELAIKNLFLALEIATKINNREIQQEGGTALAQAYVQIKEYSKALAAIEAACRQNFLLHNHRSFALYGVILLRLGQEKKAYAAFKEALAHVQTILARIPLLYTAKYTKGLALAGLALLSTGSEQAAFLTQSQDAYYAARDNCSLSGTIADAILLLNEIRLSDKDRILGQILII